MAISIEITMLFPVREQSAHTKWCRQPYGLGLEIPNLLENGCKANLTTACGLSLTVSKCHIGTTTGSKR